MKLVPLTNGGFAKVDDCHFERVVSFSAWRRENGYAVCKVYSDNGWRNFSMHQLIKSYTQVDHVDSDGLNNQESNLRECNHSQNQANAGKRSTNRSGYKGVSWHWTSRKWQASIKKDGKSKNLGIFLSKEDAARAYNSAATELFGEFAKLNVLPEDVFRTN